MGEYKNFFGHILSLDWSCPRLVQNTLFSLLEMTILSKRCKSDNFESHNSLKLSFTNIWGLCANFLECKSFLESNSPDTLAQCETNLEDLIYSGNFSVMGYIPLNLKYSLTRLHDLPVYVKEGLAFAWDLSLKNFSMGFTSLSDLLLFPQVIGSLSLCMVFYVLSSNIDQVLLSTHLLMWLSLESSTSIIRTG